MNCSKAVAVAGCFHLLCRHRDKWVLAAEFYYKYKYTLRESYKSIIKHVWPVAATYSKVTLQKQVSFHYFRNGRKHNFMSNQLHLYTVLNKKMGKSSCFRWKVTEVKTVIYCCRFIIFVPTLIQKDVDIKVKPTATRTLSCPNSSITPLNSPTGVQNCWKS